MEQVSQQVFCVNCENIARSSSGDWERHHCRAKENKITGLLNLVTGETEVNWRHDRCVECRADHTKSGEAIELHCGVVGRWYKFRTPEIYKPMGTKPATVAKDKSVAGDL